MSKFGWNPDDATANNMEVSGVKSASFDGFIGFFSTGLMGQQYIDYFNFMLGAGLTTTRGKPFPKSDKIATFGYDDVKMIGDLDHNVVDVVSKDSLRYSSDLAQFTNIAEVCVGAYLAKFPELLKEASLRQTQAIIERSLPGQGCRLLHSDKENERDYRRALTAIAFANDDFEHGEIEFWYQGIRVAPKPGMILMFPTDWTHTYRCVPPKNGERFLITSFFDRSMV